MDDVDINEVICLLKFQAQQSAVVIRWQQPSKLEWRNSIEGYIECFAQVLLSQHDSKVKNLSFGRTKICAKLKFTHFLIKILLVFVLSWTLALKK